MGKRLNRTALNWRWWVTLPIIPVAFLVLVAGHALASAEDGMQGLLDWARRGERK